MGSLINYEYLDFPFEKFDFSVCDNIPYKNQLELHPHMPEHVLNHIRGLFTEEELFTLESDSYYILHDTYGQSSVQSQSNERILIEDFPFDSIHTRAKPIIEKYLESAQGCFTFLFGNNKYRPPTDKLYRHAHAINTIEGVENRRTFTVIYPLTETTNVTEKFHIFHTDDTPWIEHKDLYHVLKLPLHTPIPDNVTSIDFPKTGELLVLEFNSVNGVHWVDGLHDTNYMCHAFDAIVLREPFDA